MTVTAGNAHGEFCCGGGGGGGGSGGCDPTPDYIYSLSASVQSSNYNAYNAVTITFTEGVASTNYVEWGLNTTYSYYESGETSGTGTSFTIKYLNPGTTYYYRVDAEPTNTCDFTGTISASTFTTPELSLGSGIPTIEYYVMGYVLGQNGQPLPGGAEVTGSYGNGLSCDSGGAPTYTQTTSSSGFYDIPVTISYSGQSCAISSWWGSGVTYDGTSYWSEIWYDSSEPNTQDGWDWQTFYISAQGESSATATNSEGGQNGIYYALAFNHSTNAACTVETGYSVTDSVYAYAAGSGGTVMSGFTATNTFPGTGSPSDAGDSVGIMQGYVFDGIYQIDADGQVTLSSFNPTTSGPSGVVSDLFYTGTDPVSSPPAPSGQNPEIISVPAGYTANEGFEADGSMTIQFGVEFSIGVSIGEFVSTSISTDISFGITGTQTTTNGVQCVIGSTSSTATQYFEIYAQGGSSALAGVEYHIWQCAASSTGGAPSTCSTIDYS